MWLFFVTQYNSSLTSFVPNFRILTQGAKKCVTEIFIGEKEKWTNKGTNKQYVAIWLLFIVTQYNYNYQALYQISES